MFEVDGRGSNDGGDSLQAVGESGGGQMNGCGIFCFFVFFLNGWVG